MPSILPHRRRTDAGGFARPGVGSFLRVAAPLPHAGHPRRARRCRPRPGRRRRGAPLHPAPGRGRRCCPPGQPPLRVLHLSDLHLTPDQRRKRDWVCASLAGLEPDLVVNTGDNLAHQDAVPAVLDALGPLLERPGRLRASAPTTTSRRPSRTRCATCCPTAACASASDRLPHRGPPRGSAGRRLGRPGQRPRPAQGRPPRARAGRHRRRAHQGRPYRRGRRARRPVGRPHARRHPRAVPPGPRPDGRRRRGAWCSPGTPTAASSACPGYGALVTNCDLPPAQAKGLSRTRRTAATWLGVRRRTALLHVSAGLGTSPYAPVRFACPPEATLLTLTSIA